MSLTTTQIDISIDDRMTRWKARLHEQRATPLLVLGLQSDRAELTVQVCNDLTDSELLKLLDAAARMIRQRQYRTWESREDDDASR